AQEFRRDMEFAVLIFVGRGGRLEVARIGQAIGADCTEFRQPEWKAVVLADVTARLFLLEDDAEFDPAWNHANLAGLYRENPELGMKAERSELRNNQQFPIRRVEVAILHRSVGGIERDGTSIL